MKTILRSWMLIGLATVAAFANPGTKKQSKAKPQASLSLEQQLANQLTYPAALHGGKGSIVVVQFRLTENSMVLTPIIFTDNEKLKADLTRQLLNAKLTTTETASGEVHTARLHFKAE